MSEGIDAARGISRLPITRLQQALLEWYRTHRRDLPWRRTRDPYRIWLSEVMLQQTQVDTALAYYERFVARFPTLDDLAAADLDEVLELWAGLGYYNRARNFHAAVREVAATYGGRVPQSPEVFGSFAGVGPYTTGAVLSIAYDKPVPAVDGNVQRVLARLLGIFDPVDRAAGRRAIWEAATALLPADAPGDWNQALMELGALVCRPSTPRCSECPLAQWCQAAADGTASVLPVTNGRNRVRPVERIAVGIVVEDALLLVQRPEKGLLAGMWDLPALEGKPGTWPTAEARKEAVLLFLNEKGFSNIRNCRYCGRTEHRFSHVEWHMWVYRCEAGVLPTGYRSVPLNEVMDLATGTGIRKALRLVIPEENTLEQSANSESAPGEEPLATQPQDRGLPDTK